MGMVVVVVVEEVVVGVVTVVVVVVVVVVGNMHGPGCSHSHRTLRGVSLQESGILLQPSFGGLFLSLLRSVDTADRRSDASVARHSASLSNV